MCHPIWPNQQGKSIFLQNYIYIYIHIKNTHMKIIKYIIHIGFKSQSFPNTTRSHCPKCLIYKGSVDPSASNVCLGQLLKIHYCRASKKRSDSDFMALICSMPACDHMCIYILMHCHINCCFTDLN